MIELCKFSFCPAVSLCKGVKSKWGENDIRGRFFIQETLVVLAISDPNVLGCRWWKPTALRPESLGAFAGIIMPISAILIVDFLPLFDISQQDIETFECQYA